MASQWEKQFVGDRKGLNQQISQNPTGWTECYGGDFASFFKSFTTYLDAGHSGLSIYGSGVPHYSRVVTNAATTVYGASATLLSPYGNYTLHEGILSGSGYLPSDIDSYLDPDSVRTFGLKTPGTLVGVGYDIFGYPAPNFNLAWTSSGVLASGDTAVPSSYFAGSGTSLGTYVKDVPPEKWLAGPFDARWDNYRKVWTVGGFPYHGRIVAIYLDGVVTEGGPNVAAYIDQLRFDVEVFDGVAYGLSLTGIAAANYLTQSGSLYGDHKIIVPRVNNPCFIMPVLSGSEEGRPIWGVWCQESPASEECTTESNPPGGSILITDDETDAPSYLEFQAGQVLVGNGQGVNPSPAYLNSSTGINIVSASGSISIGISITGIARKYLATLPTGATVYNIFHSLNSEFISTTVFQSGTNPPFNQLNPTGYAVGTSISGVTLTFASGLAFPYNVFIIG